MQYTIKVPLGKTAFLWGGEGISDSRACTAQLTLMLRVAEGDEPVKISSFGSDTMIWGTLREGEAFAIPLLGKSRITAQTVEDDVDSRIICELHMDK